MGVRYYSGYHCGTSVKCDYIIGAIIYGVGFAVAVWLQTTSHLNYYADPSLSKDESPRKAYLPPRHTCLPPPCLRRDACLWPVYAFLFFLPALLWPVIVAVGLVCFAGFCVWEGARTLYRRREDIACCGRRLGQAKWRRRKRGEGAEEELYTTRLRTLEQSGPDPVVRLSQPVPSYTQTDNRLYA